MSFTTRPELRGTFGAISATHWLASAVGMSLLERGRTAFDAAVAAGFVLQVVEPHLNGQPGPNADLVVAYTGAVAPEAIEAVGMMAEDRRDIGLLAVTSADRLNAGWTAAQRAREYGHSGASSHVERLLADIPNHCGLVTVVDGHPATLAWLGSVHGHKTRGLGVEHFGQTGTIADLYRHFGIDSQGIIAAGNAISPGRPIRHLRSVV